EDINDISLLPRWVHSFPSQGYITTYYHCRQYCRDRGSGVEMGMCTVLQRNGTMTIEFGLSPYVCLCGVRSIATQHMMLLWWFKCVAAPHRCRGRLTTMAVHALHANFLSVVGG